MLYFCKEYTKQECIPVGCVPYTCQPSMWWSPLGVRSRRVGTYPLDIPAPPVGTWDQRYPLDMGQEMPTHPPLWTEWLTDACENINFPQLLLRSVMSDLLLGCIYIRAKAKAKVIIFFGLLPFTHHCNINTHIGNSATDWKRCQFRFRFRSNINTP